MPKKGVSHLNASTMIVGALALLVGTGLGALLSWGWSRRKAGAKDLAWPARWPLQARKVVNGNENKVWHGLKSIFHDHMVLVKIPVLRFTRLQDTPALGSASGLNGKAEPQELLTNRQWLDRLGRLEGVYTTFTVCTLNGQVIGCVDVPGGRGFSESSSAMKEALLLDCGIAYAVADALTPTDAARLRELFLGEVPAEALAHQVTRGGDSNFYSELAAFTRQAGSPR